MAKKNEEKIIKIQTIVKMWLAKNKKRKLKASKGSARGRGGKAENRDHSARKNKEISEKAPNSCNNNEGGQPGEILAKISHRSGEVIFKGGGMPDRGVQESHRNGLVYAKALTELPDYSSYATRETEKLLGPFVYDLDDKILFDLEIITRGPYELDNGAIY